MYTKIIFLVTLLLTIDNIYSQNLNPYQQFGYLSQSKYIQSQRIHGLEIKNLDNLSELKRMVINLKNRKIFVYDGSDSVKVYSVSKDGILRFVSVDPLTKKYPQLTPYQFASNTPIRAIDLDGLEAFIVPGTTQTKEGAQFSQPLIDQLKRIGHNSQSDVTFRWHAPLNNDEKDRKDAAERLVQHIWEVRSELLKNGKITDQEPITLIGYSHGGNVAIQAAGILKDKYDTRVNLITISTPAYNRRNDIENPAQNVRINQHYQFAHQNDQVTTFYAQGSRTYTNNKTINYLITDKEIPISGSIFNIQPHFLPYDPKFVDYLKKVPAMTVPVGNTGLLDDFINESFKRH